MKKSFKKLSYEISNVRTNLMTIYHQVCTGKYDLTDDEKIAIVKSTHSVDRMTKDIRKEL